jgi:esterase/lipase superfamily enzyme
MVRILQAGARIGDHHLRQWPDGLRFRGGYRRRAWHRQGRDPGRQGHLLSYGTRRRDALAFGRFDVSIPKDHRLSHIERPSIWRLDFSEDPNKHFVIDGRKAESEQEFYRELTKVVRSSAKKDAFVFIHGFNVTFEDAIYRTAQLAYDLEFSGAAILYSWPSNGRVLDYAADLNNNDWTVPHLKVFLESVVKRTGAKTVHLIAHSMGNRLLSNALAQLATTRGEPSRPHFKQVILTAPDIDAEIFRALANSMAGTADRITLYASANDKALRISKTINGHYRRAGDASGAVLVIPGVDSVDASAVDTDLIGHVYYGDNRSVLTDIFSLLSDGKPPGQRFGLQEVRVTAGKYWRFRP